MIPHIAIISASVRTERNSHRVALFFRQYILEKQLATAEILDLQSYNFPLFEERLQYLSSPPDKVIDFSNRFRKADGILIVTPEYNGGYPASLKNVIDLLTNDWKHKPVAISTASDGDFGGTQVITSLQFSLWKIKAFTVPAMFPVPRVAQLFNVDGSPTDKEKTDKRASGFLSELLWFIEARKRME